TGRRALCPPGGSAAIFGIVSKPPQYFCFPFAAWSRPPGPKEVRLDPGSPASGDCWCCQFRIGVCTWVLAIRLFAQRGVFAADLAFSLWFGDDLRLFPRPRARVRAAVDRCDR